MSNGKTSQDKTGKEQQAADSRNSKTLFPDPLLSDAQGLVAVGGSLDASTLAAAYREGIFPWPTPGLPPLWFSPDPRAVLFFQDLHLPRSYLKWKKKFAENYFVTTNTDFVGVMRACAQQPRPGQSGTWITEDIIQSYVDCFQQGWAYSVEVWKTPPPQGPSDHPPELVAGLYGILQKYYASAESMFHRESNCSKLALEGAVDFLKNQNYDWVDIQMLTSITKAFGAGQIPRSQFLEMIVTPRK